MSKVSDPAVPAKTEEGNTKPPQKKQISPARYWCFTWNKYPKNYYDLIDPVFQDHKWIVGEEVGESGTPHLQGYIEFDKKKRPASLGLPKQIHWEKCKGNRLQNVRYCSKEGKFCGNLRPPREVRFPVMDKQWEKDILNIIKSEPDDRTIHWYWSEQGNMGKTTFTKYMMAKHEAIVLSGKGADVRNGALTWLKDKGYYPEICIFPIPRSFNSDYLSYEAIENVKDACFYSGKYEGGAVCEPCPHLFVFANFPPDESRMSADRWVIRNIDE